MKRESEILHKNAQTGKIQTYIGEFSPTLYGVLIDVGESTRVLIPWHLIVSIATDPKGH